MNEKVMIIGVCVRNNIRICGGAAVVKNIPLPGTCVGMSAWRMK